MFQKGFYYSEINRIGVISKGIQLLFYLESYLDNGINVTNVTYMKESIHLPYRWGIGKKFIRQSKMRISNKLINEYDYDFSCEMVCSISFIAYKTSIIIRSQENNKEYV